MDTSFWDDDEERVQIVYEDDQLPPVQAPQDGLPVTAATGRKFDLRERFAEGRLKAAVDIVFPAPQNKQRVGPEAHHDKQLHQYASQALEAAAAHAGDSCSSPPLNPAAITPQIARTGTADASSSHQPERHHSFTRQQAVHEELPAAPASQPGPASPNAPSRAHPLFSQAAPAQQGSQQAHDQGYNRQTPAVRTKSSKKTHPLYTSAPATHQKPSQQRKAKQKIGNGFAIRQPVQAPAAGSKPISTADALRQLTGTPADKQAHALGRHNAGTGQQPRAGSIAELLGDIVPVNHDDVIEEVEAQDQQLQLLSPSRQQLTKSLLDSMLDGEARHIEIPMPGAEQAHAGTPWTPAVRHTRVQAAGHNTAATPSMTLQRQFIASLQDTPVASASQFTASRSRATPGSLTARLNRIVQLEKAQQAQFEAAGSLGGQTMDVTITEHCLEGHVIKCRCCKAGNEADQVFVMFSNKLSRDVNLLVGGHVTIHAPWTDLQIDGCSVPVILCQYVSAAS